MVTLWPFWATRRRSGSDCKASGSEEVELEESSSRGEGERMGVGKVGSADLEWRGGYLVGRVERGVWSTARLIDRCVFIDSARVLRSRTGRCSKARREAGGGERREGSRESRSFYNDAAASTAPVALKVFGPVTTISTGHFHCMNFAQPVHFSSARLSSPH